MECVAFHATELFDQNEHWFLTQTCRSPTPTSRPRLIRDAIFLEADRREIALRQGRHNANCELGRALNTEFVCSTCPSRNCGPRRLLRAARPRQRSRGLRPAERVLVSDPDPRLHRLLAGQGNLTDRRRSGLPVRPRPAASCQPDRAEERHPLRRDQDRPRLAQDAPALACISAPIWSVP